MLLLVYSNISETALDCSEVEHIEEEENKIQHFKGHERGDVTWH